MWRKKLFGRSSARARRSSTTTSKRFAVCTRACRYCYVNSGKPDAPPDPLEPLRLAQTAAQMGLTHVVVTSVDRDDVADRGAAHYAATIRAIKSKLPAATVEVLTPDFLGVEE